MAKAYWISCYRSIKDPDALAAYAKLAGPAIQAAGGRFLARGMPAKVYEGGVDQRTVLIEFDSLQQAIPRTTRCLQGRAASVRQCGGAGSAHRRGRRLRSSPQTKKAPRSFRGAEAVTSRRRKKLQWSQCDRAVPSCSSEPHCDARSPISLSRQDLERGI